MLGADVVVRQPLVALLLEVGLGVFASGLGGSRRTRNPRLFPAFVSVLCCQ